MSELRQNLATKEWNLRCCGGRVKGRGRCASSATATLRFPPHPGIRTGRLRLDHAPSAGQARLRSRQPGLQLRHPHGAAYLHGYITIVPPISHAAGFEIGSGIYINASLPEECAEFLRKAKLDSTESGVPDFEPSDDEQPGAAKP